MEYKRLSEESHAAAEQREKFAARLVGHRGMVGLMQRLGFQGRVRVVSHDIVVAPHNRSYALPHPPLRIVFASDFHTSPMTHPKILAAACELLQASNPDVLLLGGDFVALHHKHADEIAAKLGGIAAPLGRFAVLGNHDIATDPDYVAERLEAAGIRVLTNRNARLPAPHDDVWICGMDDAIKGNPDVDATLRNADGVRVILTHAPDAMMLLEGKRFALVLCGHTHGGQVILPTGRPIHFGRGFLSRKFCYGRFNVGAGNASTLIVSRGVGCGTLPIRLFAHPEIVVCTLRWAENDHLRQQVSAS